MERRELFSISDTPYKGLRSDAHPTALKPGEAFDAINVRAQEGHAIEIRQGIAQELDTNGLPTNAVFWGASPLVKIQSGDWLIYLAAEDPADQKVHIYNRRYRTATGWTNQWYELTQSSGAFGDTRMAKPTEGLVAFTPIDSDPDARAHIGYLGTTDSLGPAVVAQNAIDAPRRMIGYPGASTTANRLLPINPVPTPTTARATVAEAGVFDSMPVSTAAVTASATPGGTFTGAVSGHVLQTGAAGTYAWEWKSGTAITVGDTGEIVMDAETMAAFGSRSVPQIGFVVEAEDGSWWDCVKLWARTSKDGGAYAWELLHDPTAATNQALNNRVHVPTNIEEIVVSAYAFPHSTSEEHTQIQINGVRLEVASDRLTPGTTFKVYWVYASGWVPGTAQYAVARMAALNEAESGGVIVASGAFGLATTQMRERWPSSNDAPALDRTNARFRHPMVQGGSLPPEFVFPIDPRLFYLYRAPVVNPTLAELQAGFADTWSVYRKDPGDDEFYLVKHLQVGEWNGTAWELSQNPDEGALFYWEDVYAPEDKNFRRRAPDAFNQTTPIATCQVYANKRLYTGATELDATGTNQIGNLINISEEGYPGRFRSLVRFDGLVEIDASSGFEARLGVEDVRALVAVDGGTTSSSVYCLTDRSLYAIDRATSGTRLFNVRRVAPFGTQSKHAAVAAQGELLWLDQARAFRASRNLDDLSRNKVQDRLDAANAIDRAQACVYKGRVYLARTDKEGNDRVLVYNLAQKIWESDDALPTGKSAEQFVARDIEGASRLLFFAPDCALFEYEKQAQSDDDGDDIPFALESGAHTNSMFGPIAAHRIAIVASIAPTNLTTKRIFSEPAATVTGEIDLAAPGALVWKYDALPGGGIPGGEGQDVRVRIEADLDAPFAILALAAEIQPTDLDGPRI